MPKAGEKFKFIGNYQPCPYSLLFWPGLSGNAVKVAIYLMRKANNETGLAYPKYRTMQRELSLSCEAVLTAIKKLEKEKIIIVTRAAAPKASGHKAVNHYAINWKVLNAYWEDSKPGLKEWSRASAAGAGKQPASETDTGYCQTDTGLIIDQHRKPIQASIGNRYQNGFEPVSETDSEVNPGNKETLCRVVVVVKGETALKTATEQQLQLEKQNPNSLKEQNGIELELKCLGPVSLGTEPVSNSGVRSQDTDKTPTDVFQGLKFLSETSNLGTAVKQETIPPPSAPPPAAAAPLLAPQAPPASLTASNPHSIALTEANALEWMLAQQERHETGSRAKADVWELAAAKANAARAKFLSALEDPRNQAIPYAPTPNRIINGDELCRTCDQISESFKTIAQLTPPLGFVDAVAAMLLGASAEDILLGVTRMLEAQRDRKDLKGKGINLTWFKTRVPELMTAGAMEERAKAKPFLGEGREHFSDVYIRELDAWYVTCNELENDPAAFIREIRTNSAFCWTAQWLHETKNWNDAEIRTYFIGLIALAYIPIDADKWPLLTDILKGSLAYAPDKRAYWADMKTKSIGILDAAMEQARAHLAQKAIELPVE